MSDTSMGSAGGTSATGSTSTGMEGGGSEGGGDTDASKMPVPATTEGKAPKTETEEFEEIALGSVKGKVPKALAKAMKDFEKGAQSRFEEAAQARKEAQETQKLMKLLETDPDKFFEAVAKRNIKVDPDAYAEARLAKKYEQMQMTPEQRELAEFKRQDSERKQLERSSKQEIVDQLKEVYFGELPEDVLEYPKEQLAEFLEAKRAEFEEGGQKLQAAIIEAFDGTGLPKDPFLMAKMTFAMSKRSGTPLQPKEAAAKVKSEFFKSTKATFESMDPKGIHEILGESVMKKLREYDINRVTGQPASGVGNGQGPAQAASQKTPKIMNEIEYRDYMKNQRFL